MENLRNIGLLVILSISFTLKVVITAETNQENYFYQTQGGYPKDCQDVKNDCTGPEDRVSGVYVIKPEGYEEPFEVYCDLTTEGGGWTVIQRRKDNSINFARPWKYYKEGFGFLHQEFWLGNDKLAYLTNQRQYVLRIEMEQNGQRQWVMYDDFQITDEKGLYKMVTLGAISRKPGNLQNRMSGQVGMPFSTIDRVDPSISRCAEKNGAGGWWFSIRCMQTNLNGEYGSDDAKGFRFQTGALTFSEMKIRPTDTA